MKEGDIVKFNGDLERLLSGILEREELMPYFISNSKFLVVEVNQDNIEIFADVQGSSHYFYVDSHDLLLCAEDQKVTFNYSDHSDLR